MAAAEDIHVGEDVSSVQQPSGRFASVAMAMPKGGLLRLVTVYQAVIQQLQAMPWRHPNLEQAADILASKSLFSSIDLEQSV